MRRAGRYAVRAVLVVTLAVSSVAPSAGALSRPGQEAPTGPQSPPPKALILVNAETGEVLFADHEHDALPPASTAKIMTALTAIERLPTDALINVSELAAAQPPSKITMLPGQQWKFSDSLASLMLASANDAAYAIAETAGGSLDGFAAAMNEAAERYGMEDSTFSDPAGFDDEASFGGGPRMSAYDVAIATRNALEVPEIAILAATPEIEFVDPAGATRTLTNHNKMLPGNTRGYDGATGFKTGYTDQAGHTFAGTAERNGCKLIAVVIGTYDIYGWAAQLFDLGWGMSCEAEDGDHLPDIAVSPYAQRVEDQRGFVALARGPNPTTTSTPPTTSDLSVAAPAAALADAEAEASGSGSGGTDGESSGGFVSVRNIGIVVLALFVTLFMLRRRAVKRRRMRRMASYRTRAARMRSGGLTIVDGRYRSGTRTGPPVESHVRVRRLTD